MPLPASPMQVVGMDLIGPLTESGNGNKYVVNIVDHCSGWAESYPIPTKSSINVQKKVMNEFFPRHGIPEVIITDRGLEFNMTEFKEMLLREYGVTHKRTTLYHPQTNGEVERFNRIL